MFHIKMKSNESLRLELTRTRGKAMFQEEGTPPARKKTRHISAAEREKVTLKEEREKMTDAERI